MFLLFFHFFLFFCLAVPKLEERLGGDVRVEQK